MWRAKSWLTRRWHNRYSRERICALLECARHLILGEAEPKHSNQEGNMRKTRIVQAVSLAVMLAGSLVRPSVARAETNYWCWPDTLEWVTDTCGPFQWYCGTCRFDCVDDQ